MYTKHERIRMNRRVVVTGMGIITPCGIGKNAFAKSLCQGKSGIQPINHFNTNPFPTKIAGYINEFDPINYIDQKNIPAGRSAQLAVSAMMLALDDAGLSFSNVKAHYRNGVIIGTSVSGLSYYEQELNNFYKYGIMNPYACIGIFGGSVSSELSRRISANGPSYTLTNGCTAGTDAIGSAFHMIRINHADMIVCGGTEAPITPAMLSGFCSLHVLSRNNDNPEHASRPFDIDRDGMVLSEGAAIIILESLEHAQQRNAKILAEIIGYAATNDAYHPITPDPKAQSAIHCMKQAIDDAGISKEEIQCINAHGTATIKNDLMETLAIKKVFGKKAERIPVSAIKSMTGHSIGAAGAIEIAGAIISLTDGFIPPTINLNQSDPECDLDYVPNTVRKTSVDVILKNSFGFGGKNAVLIVRRFNI